MISRRNFLTTGVGLTALVMAGKAFAGPSQSSVKEVNTLEAEETINTTAGWNDGLAHPIPYPLGAGKERGIAFGGGGAVLLSFYVAYAHALKKNGVDLATTDIVVGTSAGSLFAAALTNGNLWRLTDELDFFGDFPKIFAALVPETKQNLSQKRASQFALGARDADPATIQAIGRAAMAARNPNGSEAYYKVVKKVLGVTQWTSPKLYITANDCYTGERLIVSQSSGIPVDVACGASSSLPGGAGPTFLGNRLSMDGGICQTSTHSDVIRGVKRALVFSLGDGTRNELTENLRTSNLPDTLLQEIATLKAEGTKVIHITAGLPPNMKRVDSIMDAKLIEPYLRYGYDRGLADMERLKAFWS